VALLVMPLGLRKVLAAEQHGLHPTWSGILHLLALLAPLSSGEKKIGSAEYLPPINKGTTSPLGPTWGCKPGWDCATTPSTTTAIFIESV
jgi:hypothetical protein